MRNSEKEEIMEVRYIVPAAVLLLAALFFFSRKRRYKATSYYRITKNPYRLTMEDKGRFGEYQIYRRLSFYERDGGKFLFNCYLPGENRETTEIDVILIHKSGVYVFESKNYSGWIYGRESDRTWTQSLKQNIRFLNPLRQNQSHVARVRKVLGCKREIPVYSLVVFSDQCVLKKVRVESADRQVTTWKRLRRTVRRFAKRQPDALDETMAEAYFQQLYPYTRVTRRERKKHIRDIRRRQRRRKGWIRRFLE